MLRPAENGANGDRGLNCYFYAHLLLVVSIPPLKNYSFNSSENGGKKAKLDPECGTLLFCGTTVWHNVGYLLFSPNEYLINISLVDSEARQTEG